MQTTHKLTRIFQAAVLLTGLAGLSACTKPAEEMGPAQKAGAAIDNAGDRVATGIHEQLDKAHQAGRQMEDAARNTGAKIEEATQDASKGIDRATEKVGEKVEQAGEQIQESARK